MTAPCLERLIEICEHPTFGPGLRKLYITPGRMTPIRIQDLMSQWHSLLEYAGAHSDEMARLEVTLQRYMNRCRNEERLEVQGGGIELLTRAFSALKAWKHDVTLSFTLDTLIYGDTTFLYGDCYDTQPEVDVPFALTSTLQPCLEAIRSSKMKFCELEIPETAGESTDLEELDIDLESFKKEDLNCFSMLTSITFALERHVSYASVQAMTVIISQARKLEVLHLSHGDKFFWHIDESERTKHSPTEFELGDNALRSIKSDKIRSLELTTMSFSKQCLLDLLQRNRDTLGALRLEECALQDGKWTEVLSYAKDSLPLLRILNIGMMYDTTRETPTDLHLSYRVAMFGCGSSRLPFEGRDKVQKALQGMIRRPYRERLAWNDVSDDEDGMTP